MDAYFVPACSAEKQRILLYFGTALVCDVPILEAVFYNSFATTAMNSTDTLVWDSTRNLVYSYLAEKIDKLTGYKPLGTEAKEICFWYLTEGRIKMKPGRYGYSIEVTIEPETRNLFPQPLPFLTIHFFDRILYSDEQHVYLSIPFNRFDQLVDVGIDRLINLLK